MSDSPDGAAAGVRDARIGALAQKLVDRGIDRNHAEAALLEQARDAVRVAARVWRAAHDRPGGVVLRTVAIISGLECMARTSLC